jgi:hypothetical protein
VESRKRTDENDEPFSVALTAKDGKDLADGLDEFLSSASLIPPAKWNHGVRFEPPDDMTFPQRQVGQ